MAITLTPAAATRVQQLLGRTGAAALRLGVKPSGCSGLSYVVEPAQAATDEDLVFDAQGVRVLVRTEHLRYLDGLELDYRQEGLNVAFRFNNPNITDSCGCGESFTVAQPVA